MILRLCYNEIGKAVAQMKHLTDKQISIFTLAMHLIFIIAMKVLIYDYQDGLLVLTAFVLLLYLSFSCGAIEAESLQKMWCGFILVVYLYRPSSPQVLAGLACRPPGIWVNWG